MTTLNNATSGTYIVRTEASSYLLDLDAKKGLRIPGQDAAELRRDNQWFLVHKVMDCTVGNPMVLLCSEINERSDVFTTRRSTIVTKIEAKEAANV